MSLVREVILSTIAADGTPHLAPLGLISAGAREWIVAPFYPSKTLENLRSIPELTVIAVEEDALRPRFRCRLCFEEMHAPFRGFNRAQAAVIEAAILLSRRHMLPREKIAREIEVLRLQVKKTSGAEEAIAWDWLMAAFQE
jgi:hypothetical protein